MKGRKTDKTRKERKKMKKCPAPIYRVTIEWSKREYKIFNDFDDAVAFARQIMEADGNKVFMGETKPGSGILRWMDWSEELPKFVTKSIGLYNSAEITAWEVENRKAKKAEEKKSEAKRLKELSKKYSWVI